MKIGVLTSSRADFGIYLPLLKKIREDSFFDLEIIGFGTHLSKIYGYTKSNIIESGFEIKHEIVTTPINDTEKAIAISIGETVIKFADFWKKNKFRFDIVLCLGDRYEMFAAVSAGITFNIKFAHIHAGEKTLGAIDNIFRHSITFSSKVHFTSTESYKKRVLEMLDTEDKMVVNVGALSLDALVDFKPLSIDEFKDRFKIDMSIPTILTTFHPETVNTEANESYTNELVKFILICKEYQFLITMPNADTSGLKVREILIQNLSELPNVFFVENLGSKAYFTAMSYCVMLIGNTSSGIIEAASFSKYVINLGERQKGRMHTGNVIDCNIDANDIVCEFNKIIEQPVWTGDNPYFIGGASDRIINTLKKIY